MPLGPEHNESDHAAWSTSIEHVRATPGFRGHDWPPVEGMSLEANLSDLERHADDYARHLYRSLPVFARGSVAGWRWTGR